MKMRRSTRLLLMLMVMRRMVKKVIMTKGWCGDVCSSDRAIIRRQGGAGGPGGGSVTKVPPPLLFAITLPYVYGYWVGMHSQKSETPPPLGWTRSHQQEPQFCLIRRQLDTWDEYGGEKRRGCILCLCISDFSVFLYFWFVCVLCIYVFL